MDISGKPSFNLEDKDRIAGKFRELAEAIENDSFRGIALAATNNDGYVWARMGTIGARIYAVDAIFQTMDGEPDKTASYLFFDAMYNRFKRLFGEAYEKELDQLRRER